MNTNKFEGESLPFTRHGWTRQIKSGSFRNGATWRNIEKVRVIGRGTMGSKLEEVHILASFDIDQGGNKTTNTRKGQHLLSLKKGVTELAFAVHGRRKEDEWKVLPYDCSYYLIVKTQREAEKILTATNWRKWLKKEAKDTMNDEAVTWTATDEEEYYKEQKAYRKKHKIPMEI